VHSCRQLRSAWRGASAIRTSTGATVFPRAAPRRAGGIGMTQVHEVHVVGDGALLDVCVKPTEKAQGKLLARQDRDVDVAVLAHVAPGTGAEQPHRCIMLAERREHDAAQFFDRPFAGWVHRPPRDQKPVMISLSRNTLSPQ